MNKYFIDNVYGSIKINPMLLRIIHTPEFQRLKNIKQLGNTHYTFMGATHTRFEHSIGVSHLCGVMINNIRTNQPELGITDIDVLLVQVAGLCHDIGHCCFSHLFDNRFLKTLLADTNREEFIGHEYRSKILFEHINEKYDLGFTVVQKHKLFKMITPESQDGFIYQIVSNSCSGLDCDKMDYLVRDSRQIGVNISVNVFNIIQRARVINDKICFPKCEETNIFQLFQSRYMLHKNHYQHRTTHEIDSMITDALFDLNERMDLANLVTDMESICLLTDNIVEFENMLSICNPESHLNNSRSNQIMKRIKTRDFYEAICYHTTHDAEEINKLSSMKEHVKDHYPEIQSNLLVYQSRINYSINHFNPMENVNFYDNDLSQTIIPFRRSNFIEPASFQEYVIVVIIKDSISTENHRRMKSECIEFIKEAMFSS